MCIQTTVGVLSPNVFNAEYGIRPHYYADVIPSNRKRWGVITHGENIMYVHNIS